MHPVQVEIDYRKSRSRLTTFFRLILAIPHVIFLYVFGLVATVVTIIAWFAIIIVGRYPRGLWNLAASYQRYATRVYAYVTLASDGFPPFSGDAPYEVDTRIEHAERQARWKTLIRAILIIPAALMVTIVGYALQAIAIALWFWIVFVGRAPKPLQDFMQASIEYYTRFTAYALLLVDAYPGFDYGDRNETADAVA